MSLGTYFPWALLVLGALMMIFGLKKSTGRRDADGHYFYMMSVGLILVIASLVMLLERAVKWACATPFFC